MDNKRYIHDDKFSTRSAIILTSGSIIVVGEMVLLHTISWFFANTKGLSNIEVGYYVWLTAYAVLFAEID